MKRVEIGFLQSEVFTEMIRLVFYKVKAKIVSAAAQEGCYLCFHWQLSSSVTEVISERRLVEFVRRICYLRITDDSIPGPFQGPPSTSGPGKQLVGSCLCFAFWPLHTEPPIIDNLPFVEPFLLGIALQPSVFDNEPHPVQQSHWGQGGGGGGEIIIQNDFVQKQWLTVVANGILWGHQPPRTNSTEYKLAFGDGVK